MKVLIILILVFILLHLLYKYILSKFKSPKIGAIAFCNGGVKCGKSFFSLFLAISNYRIIHFKWKILSIFRKDIEEPLLYSNIPLKCPYVPLTTDMLLRKERLNYKSVTFLDEASLVADSQLIKDRVVNLQLLKFVKLYGHETHGGILVYNSHSIDDMHYSFKRGLSQYYYVYHLTKWIPFFCIAHVRECIYAEDGTTVNTFDKDIEQTMRKVLIPKRYFKYYDSYAFSYETDPLPHNHKPLLYKTGPPFPHGFRPTVQTAPCQFALISHDILI